jgi:nucleoside-diphosphate kinase
VSDSSIERTLILVKPDGVARGQVGEVLRRVEAKGYQLVAVELRTADEALLAGPVVAIVAQGERVIEGFRSLAGTTEPTAAAPGTIRGDLGRDWGAKVVQNLVHGSDSPESAAREIALWFPSL